MISSIRCHRAVCFADISRFPWIFCPVRILNKEIVLDSENIVSMDSWRVSKVFGNFFVTFLFFLLFWLNYSIFYSYRNW